MRKLIGKNVIEFKDGLKVVDIKNTERVNDGYIYYDRNKEIVGFSLKNNSPIIDQIEKVRKAS